MKLGIIISVVIVLIFGGVVAFTLIGTVDPPTARASGAALAEQKLPTDLKPVFAPSQSGNATATYKEALSYYEAHNAALNSGNPASEEAKALTDLLVTAMKQTSVGLPFFDDMVPMQLGADPKFGDALSAMPSIALSRAQHLAEKGDTAQALEAAKAAWALGQRLFEYSIRLGVRSQGLVTMQDAGSVLYGLHEAGSAETRNLDNWGTAMGRILSSWNNKRQVVHSAKPHIGDLVSIAKDDQDLSMRVEATLTLGIAKFTAASRGNKRAVKNLIERYKQDSNPMLRNAAEAADALTKDEMRKLS